MKLCLYSDNHWSQYSSILRKRGDKYSIRLENQIQSINWVMQLAEQEHCDATVMLGDFFDKSELNAEEITAIKDVVWANIPNYFIAGNHEMGMADHSYSSIKLFNLLEGAKIFTSPQIICEDDVSEVIVLPYILESDRKSLSEYLPERNLKKRIILSHNDIAGIQMGRFISEAGFSMDEIESNCDLFINGHLHNGEVITQKIINIGNLTGANFSEDASNYFHKAVILDTDTLEIEFIENPYAFNFYKIDMTKWIQFNGALQIKPNSIVSIKCKSKNMEQIKTMMSECSNVIESRITIEPEIQIVSENIQEELTVDHLETFKQYVLNNFENTKELMEELGEVLK